MFKRNFYLYISRSILKHVCLQIQPFYQIIHLLVYPITVIQPVRKITPKYVKNLIWKSRVSYKIPILPNRTLLSTWMSKLNHQKHNLTKVIWSCYKINLHHMMISTFRVKWAPTYTHILKVPPSHMVITLIIHLRNTCQPPDNLNKRQHLVT